MRISTEMEPRQTRRPWGNCSDLWDTRWWNTGTSQERYFTQTEVKSTHLSDSFGDRVSGVWLVLFLQAIDEAVVNFSKHPKLKETDSVLVVISSHGRLGAVLGVDCKHEQEDEFPINNIYKHLGSEECPALLNKPKILVIQAGRPGDSHVLL